MNEIDMSRVTPLSEISDKELDQIILIMGSYLSIISNKKINPAKLLVSTIKDPYFKQLFLELTDIDNLQLLTRSIIARYPNVIKSKIVVNAIKSKRKQSCR